MKIAKSQIRKIIKEYAAYTHEDIVQYLTDNAAEYSRDPNLNPQAVQELLMDDFMDNLGAQVSLTPQYQELINSLAGLGRPVHESTKRLVEYSDYPSWLDLQDNVDDISTTLDNLAAKYIDSKWLAGQNNAIADGIAKRIDALYLEAEALGSLISNVPKA